MNKFCFLPPYKAFFFAVPELSCTESLVQYWVTVITDTFVFGLISKGGFPHLLIKYKDFLQPNCLLLVVLGIETRASRMLYIYKLNSMPKLFWDTILHHVKKKTSPICFCWKNCFDFLKLEKYSNFSYMLFLHILISCISNDVIVITLASLSKLSNLISLE